MNSSTTTKTQEQFRAILEEFLSLQGINFEWMENPLDDKFNGCTAISSTGKHIFALHDTGAVGGILFSVQSSENEEGDTLPLPRDRYKTPADIDMGILYDGVCYCTSKRGFKIITDSCSECSE